MLVLKFGGSSVATAQNIRLVHAILAEKKTNFLVVVSALGGTTDLLKNIAQTAFAGGDYIALVDGLKKRHFSLTKDLLRLEHQTPVLIEIQKKINFLESLCEGIAILKELSDRTLATIMGLGEQLSSFIISHFLNQEACTVSLINSWEYIRAEGDYLQGELDKEITLQQIQQINKQQSYIAPGFIAHNAKGELTLLGRGGSDYSAAIFAAYLNAENLEIWSDVDGMLTANPKLVKSANTIPNLSYQEAFELSHFGAKVLYGPTIRPVMSQEIPLTLKNTFDPEHPGTKIGNILHETTANKIKGISSVDGLSLITVEGVGLAGVKGMARRVFAALEIAEVNVVLISQCSSEQNICIAINEAEEEQAIKHLNEVFAKEVEQQLVNPIEAIAGYSVVALVGDDMKESVGLAAKAFSALGQNGINITAIAQGASERNISAVIYTKDEKKALNVLHERFFSTTTTKKVHLFIAGVGNVGGQFLKILGNQKALLEKENNIELRIAGVANSRRMLINEEGLSLNDIPDALANGIVLDSFDDFVSQIKTLNLRNSVFIDNTASEIVSNAYASVLRSSVSVIACNKIACSDKYANYVQLKQLAKEYNAAFNYETTVGAALPVIQTIQNLVMSGDKIHKIQAVLSGSLNFIFNHYNTTIPFVEIVKRAKEEGYTEPNPLIDLSGVDVKRKILILAREAGYALEMEDIQIRPFIPSACMGTQNVEDLLNILTESESYFIEKYQAANAKNAKLKVVATFENGQASVGLEEIVSSSPFYHLEGKDNIVAINSARYPEQPLVVKGAGAGAELTAAGVFSDLMLIVNR